MAAERIARRLALLAILVLTAAAGEAPPPEPAGFWTGPLHGAVPATVAGGHVIHTKELDTLNRAGTLVLIDVSPAPRKPEGLAPAAVWLPPPHKDIPGSHWLSDLGRGALTTNADAWLRARLEALMGAHPGASLVVYCHPQCWASWNGAKRAILYGFRPVYWYPDGIEGWEKAGLPTAVAAPLLAPG